MIECVVITSDNCAGCEILKKSLKKEKIEFKEVNVNDTKSKFAAKIKDWKIMSVPTTIILKDDIPMSRFVGSIPAKTIQKEMIRFL